MKQLISKTTVNPKDYLEKDTCVALSDALVTGDNMDESPLVLESNLKEVIVVCYYNDRKEICEDFFSNDQLANIFINTLK